MSWFGHLGTRISIVAFKMQKLEKELSRTSVVTISPRQLGLTCKRLSLYEHNITNTSFLALKSQG